MGLDFSYLLFFDHCARFTVLEHLTEMAAFNLDSQTALIFPDYVMNLPFEGWVDTGRQIRWDDPSPTWEFMTVLRFEVDEAIADYLDRRASDSGAPHASKEDKRPEMAGIGYIYLTVYNDLAAFSKDAADPDLVLFQFGTPGTSMSILFTESSAIRQAFIRLLKTCQGVVGLLDMEDEAEVIWFRGREVSVRIPHAYLSLAEIEAYLGDS